jgi:hypothetical protein
MIGTLRDVRVAEMVNFYKTKLPRRESTSNTKNLHRVSDVTETSINVLSEILLRKRVQNFPLNHTERKLRLARSSVNFA